MVGLGDRLSALWSVESRPIKVMASRAPSQLRVTKSATITAGSIVGAALADNLGVTFDPIMKPTVRAAIAILDQAQPCGDERRARFILALIDLLNTIRNDRISLLGLWIHWFRKHVSVEPNSALDVELRAAEAFIPASKTKVTRPLSRLHTCPHQSEEEYERWHRIKKIRKVLNERTDPMEELNQSGFIVRLLSILQQKLTEVSESDLDRLDEDLGKDFENIQPVDINPLIFVPDYVEPWNLTKVKYCRLSR